MNILYFRSEKGRYHELLETTPARGAEQKLEYLRDQPFFDTIEVYIGSTWVKGERVAPPKEHLVTVSVVAFASEGEIHRAVAEAIGQARELEENRDTLTWYKMLKPGET